MTAPLLSIIGILLAAVSGSMLVYHGGDALESGLSRAQAASAVIVVTQVAQAVQLHDLQEGMPYEGPELSGLVDARYLRAVPHNPTGGEGPRIGTRDGRRIVAMQLSGAQGLTCDRVGSLLKRAPDGIAGCDESGAGPLVYAAI